MEDDKLGRQGAGLGDQGGRGSPLFGWEMELETKESRVT